MTRYLDGRDPRSSFGRRVEGNRTAIHNLRMSLPAEAVVVDGVGGSGRIDFGPDLWRRSKRSGHAIQGQEASERFPTSKLGIPLQHSDGIESTSVHRQAG